MQTKYVYITPIEKDTYEAVRRSKHCYAAYESKHFDTDEADRQCITDHQPIYG